MKNFFINIERNLNLSEAKTVKIKGQSVKDVASKPGQLHEGSKHKNNCIINL